MLTASSPSRRLHHREADAATGLINPQNTRLPHTAPAGSPDGGVALVTTADLPRRLYSKLAPEPLNVPFVTFTVFLPDFAPHVDALV
jgi:hypothetical protein